MRKTALLARIKKTPSLSVICVLFSFFGYAQQYHFSVEHITKTDGLSNTEITSIVQDRQGFIWIGTQYGLNKFDGYSVKVYQTITGDSNSLCDNNITTLMVDSRGDLWIGTENNGISVYDRNKDSFVNYLYDPLDLKSLSARYVTSIQEDSKGNVWVGTLMGLNKFRRETKDFERHLRGVDITIGDKTINKFQTENYPAALTRYLSSWIWKKKDYTELAKEIKSLVPVSEYEGCMDKLLKFSTVENKGVNIKVIQIDQHDNIWFGFENDSIGKFNPLNESFDIFKINQKNKGHGNISILSLCWDHDKLWLGTKDGGLMVYKPDEKKLHSYKTRYGAKLIKSIMRDSQGQIWIGDDQGLSIYDRKSDSFHFFDELEYDDKLLSADVSSILEDKQGNYWVASYQGGINLLKKNQSFNHDKFYDDVISPAGSKSVSAVLEDSYGNLWIGYFTSGIDLFLKDSKEKISFDPFQLCGLGKGTVFNIFEDSKKNIWIGTYEGGLQKYDKKNHRFISYAFKNNKDIHDIRSICEDKQGNLWMAAPGKGIGKFNPESQKFFLYKADYMRAVNSLASDWVNTIFCDKAGRIWTGSVSGVSVYDTTLGHFISYMTGNSNLSHDKVLVITQDNFNRIWIGTENGLNLFDEKKRSFQIYTTSEGLVSNFIAGLRVDATGNLWISTYNGLSRMDGVKGTIKNYSNNSGLPSTEFSIGASSTGKHDKIYFGAKSGLISFYPNKIHKNLLPPTVIITDFKLFNKSVPIGNGPNALLPKHISEVKEIKLPHDQNVITFEFTAINYIDPKQNTYAYMLEGFEQDWNYVGTQRAATYTNLDAGEYLFHVKAANNEGIVSPIGATLRIIVKPPLWLTIWAKILYAFLFLTAFYFIRKASIARIHLRNKVDLDEMKLRFFANISHELRTPLTLILSPLQHLATFNKLNKEDQAEVFEIMNSNGQRLLRLVNQLMNIYEIDAGVMKLKVSEDNIVQLCQTVFNTFRYSATKRNITYNFTPERTDITGFYDIDKVDKILSNIISNAFKYSSDGSSIKLSIFLLENNNLNTLPGNLIKRARPGSRFIKISVRDTGKGVPAEFQQKIFERFFRVEDDNSVDTGTGIGLSLARQLARIHKGDITITSESGKGSEFCIWLPIDESNYVLDEIEKIPQKNYEALIPLDYQTTKENSIEVNIIPENEGYQPILMIIEDSEDIRHYLRYSLKHEFQIIEAENGEQGLATIVEVIPDILICDVMLPGMSGIDVCSKVKKDQRTSHIPVILLTARAAESYQLQGLEEGADDYITKPFNMSVLAAKIRNIIAYRRRLKMVLQMELQTQSKGKIFSAEDIFIKKAIEAVEKHLENVEFDVEMLRLELGMSHTNLYRKLQALVGLSANQFIKNIRLKKAANLLESQELTVNEIAYAVGFRDPKYFSKSFRKQFGVLPSDYFRSNELSSSKTIKST